MKLSARDATAYFRKPDTEKAGILLFGRDAMRVSLRRQEVIKAMIGPEGSDEMRLERISASDLRRMPSLVLDGIKAQGFFPGPRAVLVEEAGDGVTAALGAALDEWLFGDAQIVVTAGDLKPASSLRKAFERHGNAYSAGVYDDPPTREEIERLLAQSGLTDLEPGAGSDLNALARALDPGDFAQTIERIALYKLGDPNPLKCEEIARLAPASSEAVLDEAIAAVADGRAGDIGPVMARLKSQGAGAVSLCLGALRHFRILHGAASAPESIEQALARARPPVFGPRRDRMARQAKAWGVPRLEQAIALLIDTDLNLRSSSNAPDMAVIERTLIRLAMLGGR
ncbi:MAG: DNA polymerase III subunit delta [Pseudomonadota bacterium]